MANSNQAVRQTDVKTRLQQVQAKLEKNPELSYNSKPKAMPIKNSVAWDNWTQFSQFGQYV
jgi:hypothetical protein